MIKKIETNCQKHNQMIIAQQINKEYQKEMFCSFCLIDMFKSQKCIKMHQMIVDFAQNELQEFKQKKGFKSLSNLEKERLNDDVVLIGSVVNGQKQGYYYYLFDDGTKELAGFFDSNKKQGLWNDFISFKYELQESNNLQPWMISLKQKKKRMITQPYHKGNKISYSEYAEQSKSVLKAI